ncbi:alcohol dehydrogenase catalytic domain-containing protein [Niveispirillum fermenti]|uniref:alcohol dehydrogenase catalytic domain-containing protein n=1 Tax=Niveispirillum fermenti TaxID=1233113 RepID=UPI003A85B5A2
MKAAILRAVGSPLSIEDVAISKPGPREVLIRTVATGVCHSDLHFYEGHYPTRLPTILGHESAGVVEAVGSDVRTVRPGDHVVTCLSAFCAIANIASPAISAVASARKPSAARRMSRAWAVATPPWRSSCTCRPLPNRC